MTLRRRSRSTRSALVLALAVSLLGLTATQGAAVIQFSDDFESGTLSAWSKVAGFENRADPGGAFAGSRFGLASTTGTSEYVQGTLPSALTNMYLQSAVKVQSAPNGVPTLFRLLTSGGQAILSLKTKASGVLQLKNQAGGGSRTSATVLPSGSYQLVQLHAQINGASSLVEVWLNGTQISTLTWTTSLGASPIGKIQLAHKGSSSGFTVSFDNVVVDTAFIGGGPPVTPPVPTGLHTTNVAHNAVSLSWNPSAGADGYGVYRNGTLLNGSVFGTSYTDPSVSPSTTYQYTVDAFDDSLRSAQSSPPLQVTTLAEPPPAGETIVRAAGDIACDPTDANWNNNNGTANRCRHKYTSNLLTGADAVLAIGDTQYACGGTQAYAQSYGPTWGRFKSITWAEVADAEYDDVGTDCGSAGADGFYGYFGARGGSPATTTVDGVFSFNLPEGCTAGAAGCWHVVVLNPVCSAIGGCREGQPMDNWLEQDLAANAAAECSITLLHTPRFASKASGNNVVNDDVLDLWNSMYAGGVDVVLSGNAHIYERFGPQTPSGQANANGIVQWVVGTGGRGLGGIASARLPNSQAGQSDSFGVLELALGDGTYDWRFLTEVGSPSYTDTGTRSCST